MNTACSLRQRLHSLPPSPPPPHTPPTPHPLLPPPTPHTHLKRTTTTTKSIRSCTSRSKHRVDDSLQETELMSVTRVNTGVSPECAPDISRWSLFLKPPSVSPVPHAQSARNRTQNPYPCRDALSLLYGIVESNVGTLYGIVCLDLAREHALFSSASARPDCGWMDGWTGGWSMGLLPAELPLQVLVTVI